MELKRSVLVSIMGGMLVAAGLALAVIEIYPRLALPQSHPALDRRDFHLSDVDGKRVSLATFQGKWLLLFFGYTSCPDVCPLALVNVANTLKAMGKAAKDIQPAFVTIDPERDTPQVLKTYLSNFDGNTLGLTGTPAQIASVAQSYQVFYRKHPTEDGSYLMEHSTAFDLISPEGVYLRAFRPDDDPDDFAAELLAAMHKTKE